MCTLCMCSLCLKVYNFKPNHVHVHVHTYGLNQNMKKHSLKATYIFFKEKLINPSMLIDWDYLETIITDLFSVFFDKC